MSAKAQQDKSIDMVRISMSPKLHKRVKQAALDEDVNVSEFVRCILQWYISLPRKERTLVSQGCQDNIGKLTPDGQEIPVETEPENL